MPANVWWPAFLLIILDTAEPPSRLLSLSRDSYEDATGEMAVLTRVYRLHATAVSAVRLLVKYSTVELFPWPLDPEAKRREGRIRGSGDHRPRIGGAGCYEMVTYHLKNILFRANIPHVTENLFPRFLQTAQTQSDILDRLTSNIRFRPRQGNSDVNARTGRRTEEKKRPIEAPVKEAVPETFTLEIRLAQKLSEFFETSYKSRMELHGAKETSAQEYLTTLNKLRLFLAYEPTVRNLTDDCVERFMVWLQRQGYANATINGHRARLLALSRHAWRKRLVNDVCRDVPKLREPKRIPEAWTTEEIVLILRSAAEIPGYVCGIPAGAWWVALILVLYDSGLRIGAAMAIKLDDLNLSTRVLKVPAENQKQAADQVFKLHPDTIAAIEAMQHVEGEEWLFPWSWTEKKTLLKSFRQILIRAGLQHGKRDLFHKLRRTSGTAVAAAADEQTAQRHLGHSSLQLTKRSYLDTRLLTKQLDTAEIMERPDWRINRDDPSENAAAG